MLTRFPAAGPAGGLAAVECARNRRCPRALRSLARTHNSRRAQLPGALLLAVVPPAAWGRTRQ